MRRLSFFLCAAVLAGCATVSNMAATSGSRADGIVKLSYEYGMFDKVRLDMSAGLATARQRCATWGYSGAEPFGGVTRQCQASSGYGCMRWFATVEYQCTSDGSPLSVNPLSSAPVASSPAVTAAVGPRRVRAKTASGFCLDVSPDYAGTGSASRPAITSALPRCSSLGN